MEVSYKNYFMISMNHEAAATLSMFCFLFHKQNSITISLTDTGLKMKLLKNIKIYKNIEAIKQITHLVNEFPSIWESLSFVQLPLEWWMKVYLKPK